MFQQREKGQFQITPIITIGGAIIVAIITGYFSAGNRVGMVEKDVAVIEERQKNQYEEVKNRLEKMDVKLDKLIENLPVKKETKYGE